MIMHAGEILRRRGLLSEQQLADSRASELGDVIQAAVAKGFLKERDALTALAEEVGLEFVDLRETEVDMAALEGFPQRLIYRQSLFPIRFQNGSIVVATAIPEPSAATAASVALATLAVRRRRR